MPSSAATTAEAPVTAIAAPVKVGMMSILIPVLLSTVVTLGAVGGGVFWLLKSGKLGGVVAATAAAAPSPVIVAPPASHVLALEPMIVNLADPGGRSYLRAGVSLRIRDEDEPKGKKEEEKKDPKAVDGVAVALRDTTLSVLSSETSEELLARDSREDLKKKLDEQYKLRNTETHVLEIYFTEFLVQR